MLTLLTTWLRAEAATLARAARSWPLYALLGLGALLWTAAWQIKTPVSIDLGGPDDDAFVADQHTGELNPPSSFYAKEVVTDASGLRRTYRWSQGQSRLIVPGLGNTNIDVTLRLAGARPPATGLPPPVVTMTVRGQVFPLQTTGDLQDYVKFVGRGPWAADNLVITLDSPTFTPPGDARALGVLVDSVTITPLGDNGQPTGLRPWTIPSLGHLAFWLATLAVLYGTLFRLGGPGLATGGAGLGMLLLAAGIVGARPWVGFLAPQAPILAAWGYALSVLGLPLAAWGLGVRGWGLGVSVQGSGFRDQSLLNTQYAIRNTQYASRIMYHLSRARWLAAAFAAAFVLRLGGLTYPQFLSSDLSFHLHKLLAVLSGTWAFASRLPDGTLVPYPPAAYLLLAPFAPLVPDGTLLLRAGAALLDASTVFPLAYITTRLMTSRRADTQVRSYSLLATRYSLLAAWAYAVLPAAFVYFSAGNYSNLIAQATFAWSLAPWVALLLVREPGGQGGQGGHTGPPLRAWRAAGIGAGLVAGLTLTFLGHYGMLIAGLGLGALASVPPLITGPALARRRALMVLAALAGAVALSFILYYANWLPEMRGQVEQVLQGGRRGAAFDPGALLAGTVRRLGSEWGGALALGGLAGLLALVGMQPGGTRRRLVAAWVGGALATGVVFAALDQTVGDSIRYPLLLAPWIALGAGTFWGLLARRGAAGPLFVALLGGAALWHLLVLWITQIFTRYH